MGLDKPLASNALSPLGLVERVFGIVPSIETSGRLIGLLPIPAMVIRAKSGRITIDATNMLFDQAALGCPIDNAALLDLIGARITAFVESDRLEETFPLQFGDRVERRYFRVAMARVTRNAEGRCLVTFVDQTAELRTEDNLRRAMLTDSLTGLPNRAGFSDLVEHLLDEAPSDFRYAIIMLDLDRFSRVNACLGSMSGDELLITVARRLKGVLRAHDVLARSGGDEFAIFLAVEDGNKDVSHVTKRVASSLSTPFRLSGYEIRVACSVGVAFGTARLDDPEELIRHAQFAMKRSKGSGHAEAYQPQAFDIAREQFGMETALRRAIDRGHLRLNYQPIYDLASGRLVSFEALARWRDEAGAEFLPSDFIPVAEESGLIVPLGRWAIEEAVRRLAEWDARFGGDCGVKIAVNLSAIQLQRDSITPLLQSALTTHGLPGSRFTLELTESALVTDPDRIAGIMHGLKGLGTTIAMDDFGTGYSNLAYLQKLPIDILKIDRSFVTGMLADRDKVAIVRAILSLAQALGMQTTAEGVETNDLAQTLAALGCTYGQGFVYARPLEAEDAYALLENRRH
ncbi:EAL domain-containing protein [Sphingomonas populi]|uniref:EAL domain-containing protein n=2 Tax=Sphingomonas populi TaxID=2484750 RepID=A0A4Q6Y3R0_9SPHN|nr:EAL domain-containing protein [Sphingomonas populi]